MTSGMDCIGVGVVFTCHDGQGNFLMTKRSNKCRDEHGTWCFPSGGTEFGETFEKTLEREVREEFGAQILKKQLLGVRELHREHQGKKTHWVLMDFKVLVDPKRVRNGEPEMADEIGWFPLNALPAPLHSQTFPFLEKYMEQLRA